jgi:hypothetical protein
MRMKSRYPKLLKVEESSANSIYTALRVITCRAFLYSFFYITVLFSELFHTFLLHVIYMHIVKRDKPRRNGYEVEKSLAEEEEFEER